jgi:hypothetical protein
VDSFELKLARLNDSTPTSALSESTRGGEKSGRILQLLEELGRAQRRRRMVRDLETFLAVRAGGWPRKLSQGFHQRSRAEAGDAFASN